MYIFHDHLELKFQIWIWNVPASSVILCILTIRTSSFSPHSPPVCSLWILMPHVASLPCNDFNFMRLSLPSVHKRRERGRSLRRPRRQLGSYHSAMDSACQHWAICLCSPCFWHQIILKSTSSLIFFDIQGSKFKHAVAAISERNLSADLSMEASSRASCSLSSCQNPKVGPDMLLLHVAMTMLHTCQPFHKLCLPLYIRSGFGSVPCISTCMG